MSAHLVGKETSAESPYAGLLTAVSQLWIARRLPIRLGARSLGCGRFEPYPGLCVFELIYNTITMLLICCNQYVNNCKYPSIRMTLPHSRRYFDMA